MSLAGLVLREVEVRMKQPFVSSQGVEDSRRVLVVEAWQDGHVGYGEVPVLSAPYYNEETPATAWHILTEYLIPAALTKEWSTPEELAQVLAPVRRHYMAKAGLEGAVWSLHADLQGISLGAAIGATRTKVAAGVSVGMQPDLATLVQVVGAYLDEGYRRIKIKIKPGWDIEPLRALRRTFGDIALMADANSAYTWEHADQLRRLDEFNLLMVEQPLAPDDIVDHAKLQAILSTPICLDESIESADNARKAIELGSCRIINIKPARVGGLSEAKRIHDICLARGIPVWCGGMLETGIGRAHNVALAALPGFTLPGDISASNRYFAQDIVIPEVVVDSDGYISVPTGAGLGYAVDRGRLEYCTRRIQSFGACAV